MMERALLHRRPAAARFSAACAKGPHISKSSEVFWGAKRAEKKAEKRKIYSRGERSEVGAGRVRRRKVSREHTQAHTRTWTHFT